MPLLPKFNFKIQIHSDSNPARGWYQPIGPRFEQKVIKNLVQLLLLKVLLKLWSETFRSFTLSITKLISQMFSLSIACGHYRNGLHHRVCRTATESVTNGKIRFDNTKNGSRCFLIFFRRGACRPVKHPPVYKLVRLLRGLQIPNLADFKLSRALEHSLQAAADVIKRCTLSDG